MHRPLKDEIRPVDLLSSFFSLIFDDTIPRGLGHNSPLCTFEEGL